MGAINGKQRRKAQQQQQGILMVIKGRRSIRKFTYFQIIACDRNHLQDNYETDLIQLLTIFPEEVWYEIFNHVFHPHHFDSITFENVRNASLLFDNLLLPKRVQYMSPKVLGVIADRYPTLNEQIHRYVWQIPNFFKVQQKEGLVAEQTLILDTSDSSPCPSKWQVGLKLFTVDGVSFIFPYVKLLKSKSWQKAVRARLEMCSPSTLGINCSFVPIEKPFVEGESCDVLFFSHVWHFNQPREYWHVIQPDGSVHFSILLTTYNYYM